MSQLQQLLFSTGPPSASMMPTLALPQRVSLLRIGEMLATHVEFSFVSRSCSPPYKESIESCKIHIFLCVDPGRGNVVSCLCRRTPTSVQFREHHQPVPRQFPRVKRLTPNLLEDNFY